MHTKSIMTAAIAATALHDGPTAAGQLTPPAETEVAKLLASDGAANDKFGFAIDLQGDTLLIGAPHHYSPPDGLGSVYVFERDATGSWNEIDRLFASDGVVPNEFGHSIALHGDTFIAGAPFVEDESGAFMGKAYVFVRDANGAWNEVQTLQPEGITGGDFFGMSVALDGGTAVLSGGGDAWVFVRGPAGTWSLQTVLEETSTQAVALQGGTLLLGGSFAPGDAGAMVFAEGPSGWSPEAELHLPATAPDDFAFVDVAIDGDTAVLGGRSLFGPLNGAHVFTRSAPGAWSQEDVPLPEDVTGDNFGVAVDISGDQFVVGATHNGSTGAAWVYGRDAGGAWTPFVKLVPSDSPSSFGFAVTLDGPNPAVGAWADSDAAPFAGSAYVFDDVAPPCPADLDGDGSVGIQDFLAVLASWGTAGGDVDGDRDTGIQDLLSLLAAWGECP